MTYDARPRLCTPSSDFLKELIPKAVPRKVHHLYLLLIRSIVAHRRCYGNQSGHQLFLFFRAFPLGFQGCLLTAYASSCTREQRASTALLQQTRLWGILFSSTHVIPAAFTSASVLLLRVCLGLPTFRFPWGFQSSTCRVTFDGDLRSVWPIHPHFLFLMSSSTGV